MTKSFLLGPINIFCLRQLPSRIRLNIDKDQVSSLAGDMSPRSNHFLLECIHPIPTAFLLQSPLNEAFYYVQL
jgi:hypothetical protein